MIAEHPGFETLITGIAAGISAPELLSSMEPLLSTLSGIELQIAKHRTLQWIENSLKNDVPALLCLAAGLAGSRSETGEEWAVFLLTGQYSHSPELVSTMLRGLAASPYAQVRKWAAEASSTLLIKHFDSFSLHLCDWVTAAEPEARTAACQAIAAAARTGNPAWAVRLADLIEPLMRDTRSEVRKSFARLLGSTFLTAFPDEIAHRLTRWIGSADSSVRVHAVYLFASPEVSLHWDKLARAWKKLLKDPTPAVQKAVIATLKHVEKHRPEMFPTLNSPAFTSVQPAAQPAWRKAQ